MLTPDALLQNRYRIVTLIGQGGMGAVYQAVDQRLKSQVAVKQTLCSDDELRQAFEQEARILANLRHKALPKVIDHFTEGDEQFLVMEFIPGSDLGDLLKARSSPFPLGKVLYWADQLLDALEYLHDQSPPIIHRDIKPQNLKLTERSEIILIDFGLAKGVPSHSTTGSKNKSVFGYTPNYAPPEQMQAAGTDARSDLYALAATLFHLATGKKPVDALTRAMNLISGGTDPMQPANQLNPQVPAEIAAVFHKSLALPREQRHASATEMRQALHSAGRSARISASPNEPVPVLSSESATVIQTPPGPSIPETQALRPSDGFPTLLVEAPHSGNRTPVSSRQVKVLVGHGGGVNDVVFSPSGAQVLSASQDTTLILWDVRSGREIRRFSTMTRHTYSVECATFSPDGNQVLSGSRDGTVRLWDANSGQELARLTGHTGVVHDVTYTPDGRFALSSSGDKTVRLWDVETGKEQRRLVGHQNSVMSVVVSPDGKRVLTGGHDDTARLWDLENGQELRVFRQWGGVWSLFFFPDGRRAASGSSDKTIHLWDVETGQGLPRIEGHTDAVTSIALLPDGLHLLSGSSDTTLKLWEIASGEALYSFEGHKYGVTSISLSPDGRLGASSSWDKTVRIWKVATK
ncbi:MAG: protein kinase [Blastocatellia bacterium]|nr:protein kinase [Blastocatellia bacterium]